MEKISILGTDIAERQKGDSFSDKLVFPVNVTINPKERLHIRIFPWNLVGGKMDFQIVDWEIRGIEVE